jgi:hypothetical protein
MNGVTIIDVAWKALGKDGLDEVAAWTHEPRDRTRQALAEAVPASVLALADRARNGGALHLLQGLTAGRYPALEGSELGRTVRDPRATQRWLDRSAGLTGEVFGERLGGVVDHLSRDAGITEGSAARLLALATSVVTGVVRRDVRAERLDAGGLRRYLGEQRPAASALVPDGLAREIEPPMVEIPRAAVAPAIVHARSPVTVPVMTERTRQPRILAWLLAAVILLALLFWGISRRNHPAEPAPSGSARPPATEPAPARAAATAPPVPAVARYAELPLAAIRGSSGVSSRAPLAAMLFG